MTFSRIELMKRLSSIAEYNFNQIQNANMKTFI